MTQATVIHPRQWHPAFYATIQIELLQDADSLTFENEHNLGKKPLQIDYISIDDFYKVYGYACFYKSDCVKINKIKISEITLSFVSRGYPRKLMKHLKRFRKYKITKKYKGIYYVTGDNLPIQFIIQNQLSKEENLWLKSLTDNLKKDGNISLLLDDYSNNSHNPLYESVMDMLVQFNPEQFEEVKGMCKSLEILCQDLIEEKANEKATEMATEMATEIADKKTIDYKTKLHTLIMKLFEVGRIDDIIKVTQDNEYENKLYTEFNMS